MPSIKELASTVGFKGGGNKRLAEPSPVRTLPVIDNSLPTQSNIRTSVDTYVTGQYIGKKGEVIEVMQRYTIFVAYARGTQKQTMSEIRNRIVSDFEQKYGQTFNITNVFVPDVAVPEKEELPGAPKGDKPKPLEFYEGTNLFRDMTSLEKARFDIATQEQIAETNIENIRERFRMRTGGDEL